MLWGTSVDIREIEGYFLWQIGSSQEWQRLLVLLFFLLSQFFPWYFSSWTNGEPHHPVSTIIIIIIIIIIRLVDFWTFKKNNVSFEDSFLAR
jgi:hypothetical protein